MPSSDEIAPAFESLCILTAELGDFVELGAGPLGRRRIVPILGGTFTGASIRGTVLPGGADWQLLRSDFVTELDARYVLQTDDGVLIQVTVRGLRHGPKDVLARVAAGDDVASNEYYFRTTPIFSAPTGRYDWLNRSIFISIGERYCAAVRIHFFRLL
jgi:hypothetical protein